MLIFAAVLAVVTVVEVAHAGADQAAVANNTVEQLSSGAAPVANVGGPLGAKVSDTFFNRWFGFGSVFLIIGLVVVGWRIVWRKKVRFWSVAFQCLLLTITASMVLGWVTFSMPTVVNWGGDHGHYMVEWLASRAGVLGPVTVCAVLVLAVCMVYFARLARVVAASRRALRHAREQVEIMRERRYPEEVENPPAPVAAPKPVPASPDSPRAAESGVVTFDIDEPAETETPAAQQETSQDMAVNISEVEQATRPLEDVYDPTAELSRYRAPGLDLLNPPLAASGVNVDKNELEDNKRRIVRALAQFNIRIAKIEATVGPTVTLFEVVPDEGVRIAQIKRVEEDLARSLAAEGIRIIAPIPGKGTVGIEVPNHEPQTVSISTVLSSKAYQETRMALPLAMGTTIDNRVFIQDLAKVPHLLVGGATGTGKSVGLNTIIASLIYKRHPSELKFVLIDPKMVEFHTYERLIRHFLAKVDDGEDAVVTDCEKAKQVLNSLCVEMDQRYALLRDAGVRQISEYNERFTRRRLNPEHGHRFMPYIVVIVDEFTDLIMMAGKEIEMPVARIAQKARAVGIHMIIATQRPSTNVITGIIKANFTGRISFKVTQAIDSKTILDHMGANALIGRGDMLFSLNSRLDRVQCAFISNDEIERICEWVESQPGYAEPYLLPDVPSDSLTPDSLGDGARDSLFEECARYVVSTGTASTSSFQRRWSIGYNRAGKIMDQLQEAGIVGAASGSKPRAVLIDSVTLESMLSR